MFTYWSSNLTFGVNSSCGVHAFLIKTLVSVCLQCVFPVSALLWCSRSYMWIFFLYWKASLSFFIHCFLINSACMFDSLVPPLTLLRNQKLVIAPLTVYVIHRSASMLRPLTDRENGTDRGFGSMFWWELWPPCGCCLTHKTLLNMVSDKVNKNSPWWHPLIGRSNGRCGAHWSQQNILSPDDQCYSH